METHGVSKRSHPKSKRGCNTCKRRKVKCGEEKPACKNCIKHAVECDYLTTASIASNGQSSTTPLTQSTPHSQSTPPQINGLSAEPDLSAGQLPPPAMEDLQLLHHFIVHTSKTLSSTKELQIMWRNDIPEVALSSPYIMRSIFALSSLHLAHTYPHKSGHYRYRADLHYGDALKTAKPLLADLKEENAVSLWLFSTLTFIFKLASTRGETGNLLLVNREGMLEWMLLFRGTQSILRIAQKSLLASPLRPLFITGMGRSQWRKASTSREKHLSELEDRVQSTVHDVARKEYLVNAIIEMQGSYAIASGVSYGAYEFSPVDHESTDFFAWPYMMPEEYIHELQHRLPEALAIFAHFCVLMHVWDHVWWLKGWARDLMTSIHSLLDSGYQDWIQWPLQRIGIVTDSRS